MIIYKLLSAAAFFATLIWAINKPGYDSIASAIISFAAFAGVIYSDQKEKHSKKQVQNVANNAIGIQAGRDVKVGKIDKRS